MGKALFNVIGITLGFCVFITACSKLDTMPSKSNESKSEVVEKEISKKEIKKRIPIHMNRYLLQMPH